MRAEVPIVERRLAVVVLGWNGRDDVLRCLASLARATGPGDAVVLVDNASTDGTADAAAAAHPGTVVLRNPANLGYAGGMNTGLRRALDDGYRWVLFLNQDTEVAPGALDHLFAAAARHPDAVALQPLLLRDDGATVDSAGQGVHRVPGATDLLAGRPAADAPGDVVEIFGPCGAAALVRSDALRAAGPFDEEHFLIFEDVDLAFRLRLAGGRTLLVPSARVLHRRGISGAAASASALRRFLVARNGIAIALRYWPLPWLVATSPLLVLRIARALRLRSAAGRTCGPMWRRAWGVRRATRPAARRHAVDAWLGRRFRDV